MGLSVPTPDYTAFRKMMVFIDGENITHRYQDMINKGYQPKNDGKIKHIKDVCVWHNDITLINRIIDKHEIVRAIYYTYATGDDIKIQEIVGTIKSYTFYKYNYSALPNILYPCVFKKKSQSISGKGVDIKMTIDIMNHVYCNNIDTVYLITGDGDFIPVVDEVIRCGKQIYLAAFSSGLNPELKNRVDCFVSLDWMLEKE